MRGVASVIALLLVVSACAQSDTSLNAVDDDGDGSSPKSTITADVPSDEEQSTLTTVHDDIGMSSDLASRVFICPDQDRVEFDPYSDDRSTGSATLVLEDGSEVLALEDWIEFEAGFADSTPLKYEGKAAVRLVDRTTGDERACPEEGPAGILSTGTEPAFVESCAVNPPWGVMGGQQVIYQGARGNAGTVEIHRNGSLVIAMPVGVTWDDLLEIRRYETSTEPLDDDYPLLFGAPGEIFFSDFGSPSGELSYALVVRDSDGLDVQRVSCGAVVVPSLNSVTCAVDLLDGFPRITIGEAAFPHEIRRNGEPIETTFRPGGIVDLEAPAGVELTYEVTISVPGSDAQTLTIPCGSITTEEVPLEERLRYVVDRIGPAHWYGEVTPICPDCDPTPLQLGWSLKDVYRWDDGAFTAIQDSSAVWLTSPGDLPQLLLDSIEAGHHVEAEFDGDQISQWTINGEGASYRCVAGDTAPIEIRADYHQTIIDSC